MERNAAAGYAAIGKQSAAGTPVTPSVFTPYYSQGIVTNINLMEDSPVYGNRFKRLQHLKGTRSHGGRISVMAEPETSGYWFDMLLDRSATSGSDPYTHTFGLSTSSLPNPYTLDISLESQVARFWGVQASNITIGWEDEKMVFNIDLAGLGSFYGREVASVDTLAVTLKSDYDAEPTKGLVADDLIQFQLANGSTVNTTVTSVDSATVITVGAATGVAAGDMVVLRPATTSFDNQRPFLWGLTQFFFDDTLAAAVTASATASNQTRLEPGTDLSLMWEFEDDAGSKRSGAFDPASLVRTVGDYTLTTRQFFDTADEIKRWNAVSKRAMVMRSYSGSSNQYELQVHLNNMNLKTLPPETESNSTIYSEQEFGGNYDTTDGVAMTAKVINSVATL